MNAFLTAPKHGWWLAAGAVLTLYIAFKLAIPSRRECCGQLWTPDQYADHVHRTHHTE